MRTLYELFEARSAAHSAMTATVSLYLSLAPVTIVAALLTTMFQRGWVVVIAWMPLVALIVASIATYRAGRRTMRTWQTLIDRWQLEH